MNKKTIKVSHIDELPEAARQIIADLKDERIFAISGKMGAGKTTLIKALCEELGVLEVVSSPTFALVNEYSGISDESVFHFDFYRIKKLEEVFDIGYEEYLYSGNYCFMEWPELVVDILPEQFVDLKIEVNGDDKRIIKYQVKTI